MSTSAILRNRKIAISRPQFERFRQNLARGRSSNLLSVCTVKNLNFLKSKMAAAAILKNRKIPYLGRSSSDCNKVCHTDAFRPSWPFRRLKFEILKIQHGGVRHLENSKNRHCSAAVGAISTKFGIVMQFHPLDHSDRWKIEILKIRAVNWYA